MMKNSVLISLLLLLVTSLNACSQDEYKTVEEARGISVRTTVPDFNAVDQNGKTFSLKNALTEKAVVVIFYRGQWCPICSRHLSNLQDSLSYLEEKGIQVVAVSPEKQENLKKTQEKTGASFTLLYDEDYKISKQFDVLFRPDDKTIKLYNERLDANLEEAHSDNSQRLPVPATFIINQEGEVVWKHFDRDYKERASVAQIIDNLP